MMWREVFLLVLVVCSVQGSPTAELKAAEDVGNLTSHRDEKFIFALVKISPDECTTDHATLKSGTCLPPKDCPTEDQSGTCAEGFGSCCIIRKTCGESTGAYNNIYFEDPTPAAPTPITGGLCTLKVDRVNSNICQVHLDFRKLDLSQPDADGICKKDKFLVTDGTSTPPILCGYNTGQHMYVDVDPAGGPLKLSVDLHLASISRKWDIKVTQIDCNSRDRAPADCLQYFTETTGIVSSFNFKETALGDIQQLAWMDYTVCVQRADGYCGIEWSLAKSKTMPNYGFTISGDVNAISPPLIGILDSSTQGAICGDRDYVLIPGGFYPDVPSTLPNVQNDRYCGAGFPKSVTSHSKPFELRYKTNGDEVGISGTPDTANHGFSLQYSQIPSRCPSCC